MKLEHGFCHRADYVAPSATHIVRCAINNCRAPINTHGLERSSKAHLSAAHADIERPVLATIIKFNQITPVKYFFPPPAIRGSGRRARQCTDEGQMTSQTQTQSQNGEGEKRQKGIVDVDPNPSTSESMEMEMDGSDDGRGSSVQAQQGSPPGQLPTTSEDEDPNTNEGLEFELSDLDEETEKVGPQLLSTPSLMHGNQEQNKPTPPDNQDFHLELLGQTQPTQSQKQKQEKKKKGEELDSSDEEDAPGTNH